VDELPRIVLLAGPTASGKSDLALSLAERLGAEIINADSQQVYRHFDIGTAKPSSEQLARVPHHLVSHVDPLVRFDAARYALEAAAVLKQLSERGKPALVVGGTGLYMRSLLFGVVEGPGRDDAFRAELEARAEREGREKLHAELARVDPESAKTILVNDLLRVVRALEILHLTGQRASALRAEHGFARARYQVWGRYLDPPREELYRRIDRRTETMFRHGLLDEVRSLLSKGFAQAKVMQSIGYSQAMAVIENRGSMSDAIAEAAQATRHYAKRQWTWFRKEPWLSPLTLANADVDALERELRAFFAGK
jgi:tRNA dimethylallyltransferase